MERDTNVFLPIASTLIKELLMKPYQGLTTDVASVHENKEKLSEILNIYETRLGESPYLAGENFTLADLHYLPPLHYLLNTEEVNILISSRPNVIAWVEKMRSRPAWLKAVVMQEHIVEMMKQRRVPIQLDSLFHEFTAVTQKTAMPIENN